MSVKIYKDLCLQVYAAGHDPAEEEFTVIETNPTLLNLTLRRTPVSNNI